MTDTAATEAAPAWERWGEVFDRWTPHGLMVISIASVLLQPGPLGSERLGTLGLAALVTTWVVVGHTRPPARLRTWPAWPPIYLAGVLAVSWLLIARDVAFFVFAITGFLHAGMLRPRPVVFVGTGATSFVILYGTWGGFPQPTGEETGAFLALLAVQTVLIGAGLVGADKLHELSEQRRRTVTRLEATLRENEGLQAQLVAQAHEAGIHDERQRMAREIHDTLAQGLTGVITQLEAAQQADGDPERLDGHVDNAVRLARDSLTEARRSVAALAPSTLDAARLTDAVDRVTDDWSQLTGIPVRTTITGTHDGLTTDLEVAVLRVVQEALANVARHAAATRVGVALSVLDDHAVLDVRDDGRGFDPTAARNGSYGLTAMRQRVTELGGTLTIESAPGAGTAISAALPVGRDTHA